MKRLVGLFFMMCSAAVVSAPAGAPASGGADVKTSLVDSRGSSTSLDSAQNDRAGGARTAAEERVEFSLPEGFVAELVADESVMKKAVAFNFDDAGRMWVTTASEYPLDGNEQPEKAAALYRDGGKDNVLIFDTPWANGLQKPRIWAGVEDGQPSTISLAMPMGVLPYKDGAIVQHGPDLLFLRDTDGDGRAETREVLLAGFGIQDSHLMPHGFTRGPGDWIYFAQGAFNTSPVKTKEGRVVEAKFCKMMRMKPDGSRFEICGWGLNNIWGFVIDPRGEMWIQEANDLGYPVAPFQVDMCFPGIGNDKTTPYAPFMPPPAKLNDCTMGGTGLSGLALNEDSVTWPSPWTGAFMVANPITNKIQAIRVHRDSSGYDGVKLEKLPDFLTSADTYFRPVAIQFGPDGALYVIDWYNKIISHNEVPRTHPERDRIRTRIWRIHAKSAPRWVNPNLPKAVPEDLVGHLRSANQWEANAARFELIERGGIGAAIHLPESVLNNLLNKELPVSFRLQWLWTLDSLQKLPVSDEKQFPFVLQDADGAVRKEAIRALGARKFVDGGWTAYCAGLLASDVNWAVRAEAIQALDPTGPHYRAVPVLLAFASHMPAASAGKAAREFERALLRIALSKRPTELQKILDSSTDISAEGRALACLALNPENGAPRLAKVVDQLGRPLQADELAILASQVTQPVVRDAFSKLLDDPQQQAVLLAAFGEIDARMLASAREARGFPELIAGAARDLVRREPTTANLALLVRVARSLRISSLEPEVATYLTSEGIKPAEQIEALKALRELGSENVQLFSTFATSKNEELRREAVTALASAKSARVVPALIELWPQLPMALRKIALDRAASGRAQAEAIVRGARTGFIPPDDLDSATLDKLIAVLGNEQPDLVALLKEMKGAMRPVLRLTGKPADIAETKINLPGTFTVEAWVRLDPGIDNSDNLLGRKGGADFNFYDAKFRVFGNSAAHDVVVAKTAIKPDMWTHIAVTRDSSNKLRIYLNGEFDAESATPFADSMTGLNIGETNAGNGAAASYAEFRVWDVARSIEEIRGEYLMSFAADGPRNGAAAAELRTPNPFDYAQGRREHRTANAALPAHLVRYMNGADGWGTLKGAAHLEQTRDFPELLTAGEANALAGKFANFRTLAERNGDAARGRNLFAGICMACHMVNGQGGNIGPNLSGAGAMGTEALLRNILTPNAQLESGYYRHDVELKTGDVLSGFLVSQNDGEIVLRQVGADDRTVPRSELKKLTVSKKSLMPEGLLEGLPPDQVSDLFAYLRTLK